MKAKKAVFLIDIVFALLVLVYGCSQERSPTEGMDVHPETWMDSTSRDFHGKKVITVGLRSCRECHGDDYAGGRSGVSCSSCHDAYPHSAGWLIDTTQDFHGAYVRGHGWSMVICQTCHGLDYEGGRSGQSCTVCHPGTPEACNTCHGSGLNAAPPEDTDGNTATTFRGVGAHQAHVSYSLVRFDCAECHVKPDSLYQQGHIDSDLPAELQFGPLARTEGADPVWDGNSCINTYCHGATISGPNLDPVWTVVDGSQGACGTCHRIPPHGNWGGCDQCHPSVVGPDTTIIDKDLHINGLLNF